MSELNNQNNFNQNISKNPYNNIDPNHQARLDQIKQKLANSSFTPSNLSQTQSTNPNFVPNVNHQNSQNQNRSFGTKTNQTLEKDFNGTNHQNQNHYVANSKSNGKSKTPKNSKLAGKIVLGMVGILVIASLGLLINNNFLQPFGRIPSQSLLQGTIEPTSDLGLFKNPEGKIYCEESTTIKPTNCEDRPIYSYYKAGKLQSGALSGYDRIIAITKNYNTEPVVFGTKDYKSFIINGPDKLNEQKEKLALPQSKFNSVKIEKFAPIDDAMIPVIDLSPQFSLTGFQSIDKYNAQKISIIQKNIGTEKRKLDSGAEVEITKFEYSLPLVNSNDPNNTKLSTIKGTNSIIAKSKLDTKGMYGEMDNSVIVTDSTGLGYEYYIQFKDKLDTLLNNASVYISQSKEIQEYIKVLSDKYTAEGRDPKLQETKELANQELSSKFPQYRAINPTCPIQFGVYKGEINSQNSNIYSVYGSGMTPFSQSRPGTVSCYGEYTRFMIKEGWNLSNMTQIGVTRDGMALYTPNSGTKEFESLSQHYKSQINLAKDVQNNSEKSVFENFNPGVAIPSESDYNSKNPILITQDPFGRTIFLAEVEYYGVN
jgi:hypothetical protein